MSNFVYACVFLGAFALMILAYIVIFILSMLWEASDNLTFHARKWFKRLIKYISYD